MWLRHPCKPWPNTSFTHAIDWVLELSNPRTAKSPSSTRRCKFALSLLLWEDGLGADIHFLTAFATSGHAFTQTTFKVRQKAFGEHHGIIFHFHAVTPSRTYARLPSAWRIPFLRSARVTRLKHRNKTFGAPSPQTQGKARYFPSVWTTAPRERQRPIVCECTLALTRQTNTSRYTGHGWSRYTTWLDSNKQSQDYKLRNLNH